MLRPSRPLRGVNPQECAANSSALMPRPLPPGTWPKASDEADGNTGRPQPGFFRITGNKYFVLYRSQAINILYSTSGSLVFPDHRQKIFRTLPITGNKYFVLYLRWLGEGDFLVQILCGGSVIGHDCEADGNAGRPQPGFFRITGKKYFVPYRSQAKNISYSTSDGLGRGIF